MKKVVWVGTPLLILIFLGVFFYLKNDEQISQDHGFEFKEMTKSNIEFVHEKPTFDEKLENIMPWMSSTGAAVATADFNQDGYMDLYFVNSKKGSLNALYKNNGDGTFTNVAEEAGVADLNKEGVSSSAVWFDYDNDGYPDLFVGMWGKSYVYKNNGDSTFTDVTNETGIQVNAYVSKAITLDYNRDGHLDLYIGTYFRDDQDLWNLTSTKIMYDDFENALNGGKNILYKNNGDGTFSDVSKQLGVEDTGWTLAAGSADVNNDGWPDIYNANDFGPDTLYINKEGKSFEPVVQSRGVGDDTFKGMNVDFADIFHDGNLSFYISNISKPGYLLEGNQLWHAGKDGVFVDKAPEKGIKQAGFSWGAKFFDVNNSGNQSLMVTNGFISANKEKSYWFDMGTLATTPGYVIEDAKNWIPFGDKDFSGYENKFLFLNDGQTFKNVALDVGLDFVEDGRGIAAVDLLNEGVLDLAFANQGGRARVYKNTITNENNWIKLDLTGTYPSNRDAVGTRVIFEVDGVETIMERDGGNSHGGQSDPRIHFGLGTSSTVDKITIKWPSGREQVLTNVSGNQILKITEEAE
ncbi:CRTAC1 family protein [Cytobacillus pseudoceanisediminis]|uniref:CRTAC1 family protein n=1 Tax=Cytobacillus pseudoceanisediminis TaxID=3051614 RepID=UPI003C2FE525